jgi:hypothetical protein
VQSWKTGDRWSKLEEEIMKPTAYTVTYFTSPTLHYGDKRRLQQLEEA